MPYSAGTVFLQVVPSYDNFMTALRKDASGLADELNKALQKELDGGQGVAPKVDKQRARKTGEEAGEESAKGFGSSFEKELQSRLKSAAAHLPKIKPEMDASDADRTLADLGKEMDKLAKKKIGIDVDAADAIRDVAAIEAEIRSLTKGRNTIDFQVNASRALAEIAGLRKSMEGALRDLQVKINPRIEGAFERKLKQQVRGALESLPPMKIDADSTAAERKIADVRKRLQELQGKAIGLDLNASDAVLELAAIRGQLDAVKSAGDVDIQVRGDTTAASLALKDIEHIVERLDGQKIKVKVDVDGGAGGAGNGLSRFMGGGGADDVNNTANSFRAFNGVLLTAITLGPALIPVLAGIIGGLAAVGPMAVAGAAGLGILVAGFSGISDAVTALGNVQKNQAADALAAEKTNRSAARGLENAQRTLKRATADAAQANEDAARRTNRALKDAAQSAKDANEAVERAQEDAARTAVESSRRIVDAQRDAARANADAARAVEDARERQVEAIERAAEAQEAAERRLANAQRDARRAQLDLVEARATAQRQQEDLAARQAGGRLDERQGLIDVFNATVENTATQADPGATNLEKEQASIGLERAQLALANTRRENARLAQERAKADQQGVNGSDVVTQAQDRVTQALEAQKEAQAAVAKAATEGAKTQADAADSVNEALRRQRETASDGAERIAEAQRAQVESARASAQAIGDAEQARARAAESSALAIEDARRAQARTAADGQRSVADAKRGLIEAGETAAEATRKVGDVGSASERALEQAMGALGPAGQHFARFIFGLTDEWHAFRDDIQQGLLPGVEDAITMLLNKYTPQLHGFLTLMGGVLGDVFRQIGTTLTNPAWQEFFDVLGDFLPQFTKQFTTFSLNIATAFANIFVALAPTSLDFGEWLVGLSEDFKNFTAGLRSNPDFQNFLGYLREVGPEIWALIVNIGGAVVNIARGLAPWGETIMNTLSGLARFIKDADPKVVGAIAMGFIALIGAFQVTAGLTALLGPGGLIRTFLFALKPLGTGVMFLARVALPALFTMLGTLSAPVLIVIGVVALLGIGLVLLWRRSETFRDIVKGVFRAVGDAAVWMWDKVVKPAFKAIKDGFWAVYNFFKGVYKNYWKPMFELIGAIAGFIWTAYLKPGFKKITDGFWSVYTYIKGVYDKYLKPVFTFLGDLIETYLANKFKGGVEKIKSFWDGLKKVAAKPIEFIVNTIINKGIVGNFNKLAKAFNTTPIPEVKLPADWGKYAAGGKIGGYSPHPKADNIPIWATANEFMQPVSAVDYYGVDVMERLRKRQIPREALRGYADGGLIGGYASGGVVRGGHPTGGRAGLIAFGRLLESMGFRVAEGPAPFGPVHRVHSPNSDHYRYMALDINRYPGESNAEKRAIDKIIPLVREYGLKPLWRVKDHFNHLHVSARKGAYSQVGGSGGGGEFGGGGGFLDLPSWMKGNPISWMTEKVGDLAGKVAAKFGKSVFSEMLDKIPSKLAGAITSKLSGIVDAVSDIAEATFKGAPDASTKGGIKGLVNSIAGMYGWDQGKQWNALSWIIEKESSWNPNAQNPTSTAYGLFQFLNSTWGGVGASKTSNPNAQTKAGLKYIKQVYGTPDKAMRFHQSHNWYSEGGQVGEDGSPTLYDAGGVLSPGMTSVLNASGKPEAILTNSEWKTLENIARGQGGSAPLVNTIDARSYGSDLRATDVADEIMFGVRRLANRGGRYAYAGVGAERMDG